jgi:S-DNA-T family DNA segregation ATPase FtsK/SpoIIIE
MTAGPHSPGAADDDAGRDEDDDDVAEGQVVPFPGVIVPAAPAKPQRGQPGEWKPVIPQHLRTREGIARSAGWHYRRARHHSLYHGVRIPGRIALTLGWAAVGLTRITFAQLSWWWVSEQTYLRHSAAADGDAAKWLSLNKHVREVRLVRGLILLGEGTAVTVGAIVLTWHSPYAPLLWIPVGVVAVPVLAWIGRPDDKPIVTSSVVPVAVERLTIELIIRALGALGIAEMNKALREDAAKAITTIDGPMRDGPGWLWRGDLPHGVTAGQVSEKREELSSGLRRPLGTVWPETDHKRHAGALSLYVADEDMTTAEQPPWPLAKRGKADMFTGTVFAFDPRGRPVTVTLMFVSIIIGSIPRMGKTFLLRLLLLIAALDVRSELHMYDLKGTGDLAPLRSVAHRYRAGDDPDDIEYMVADFRALQAEMRRRTKVIRRVADEEQERCPENKVTPELAADKSLRLHPIVAAIDECQIAFEHPAYGEEMESICTDLTKRGPALGMLLILATQRPDAKSIPTGISANAVLRMCLKVMGQLENDMVLGTSQYRSGIRSTQFSFDEKGVMYFAGEGMRPKIVRSQYIDGPAAKVIAARARVMRQQAGRLTGYAADEDSDQEKRSFLDDVLAVFGDDRNLWSETIAERLSGAVPSAYADITPAAVASQLRALGVAVKKVREPGREPRAGCERAGVAEAAGHG